MTEITWTNGVSSEFDFDRYETGAYDTSPPGTEILVEYDWAGDYEFDMIVVWRQVETGELRAAHDSGCSCPNPFAGLTWDGMLPIKEVSDLDELFRHTEGAEGIAEIKAKVHRSLRDARLNLGGIDA